MMWIEMHNIFEVCMKKLKNLKFFNIQFYFLRKKIENVFFERKSSW
jgi:hypothetical protein